MSLEKSTIQDHFYIGGLTTQYMQAPRDDDESRVHIVKGLKATLNEFNVAKALDKLGLDYRFQMAIGTKGQTGTVILDFLVETVPLPTPLWVHGEHWHMGERAARDQRNMAEVDNYLGQSAAEPVVLWGDETETETLALNSVRRAIV